MTEAFNIDCMEYMKTLKDKAFELAITDPPYGIGVDGQKLDIRKNPKHNRKYHEKKGWDKEIPQEQYFKELQRVSKNQIIWGGNYFIKHLSDGHKGWIIWDKGQRELTMSDCEIAYSSFDCPTRIVTINRVELLKEGTIHPTQKPVKLYTWLLQHYANKGDRILDTHLGSGSSRIAAEELGYDFVGCEIDKTYFDLQEQRFAEYMSQPKLEF